MIEPLTILGITCNLWASKHDLKTTQVPDYIYISYLAGFIGLTLLDKTILSPWATLTPLIIAITTSALLSKTGKWHTGDTLALTTALHATPGPVNHNLAIILLTYITTTYILQEKTGYKEKYGGIPAIPGITLGQTLIILKQLLHP